jgi:hypothetical protein
MQEQLSALRDALQPRLPCGLGAQGHLSKAREVLAGRGFETFSAANADDAATTWQIDTDVQDVCRVALGALPKSRVYELLLLGQFEYELQSDGAPAIAGPCVSQSL